MNCTCIYDLKKKFETEAAEKIPSLKGATIESVDIDMECMIGHNGKFVPALYIPVTIYHSPVGRKKKTEFKIIANYCPICGKPIFDDAKDGDSDA